MNLVDAFGSRSGPSWHNPGEVRCWATLVALSGGALVAGDHLGKLNAGALDMINTVLGNMTSETARPLDLMDALLPEVWVSLTHCAFFNWSSQMKSFSFEKYPELHKFRSGVNLWANGSVDSIQVSVPPHDVVYLRGTDQDYGGM